MGAYIAFISAGDGRRGGLFCCACAVGFQAQRFFQTGNTLKLKALSVEFLE
jgi:hypothetical protein